MRPICIDGKRTRKRFRLANGFYSLKRNWSEQCMAFSVVSFQTAFAFAFYHCKSSLNSSVSFQPTIQGTNINKFNGKNKRVDSRVYNVRARLHQASASTLRQLSNEAPEWVATDFQVSPLISMRTESLASSQSGHNIDAEAWCKPNLMDKKHQFLHSDARVRNSQLTFLFHGGVPFFQKSMGS